LFVLCWFSVRSVLVLCSFSVRSMFVLCSDVRPSWHMVRPLANIHILLFSFFGFWLRMSRLILHWANY
jgi:hypothetical protein